jgi:hypothetical protein
LHELNSAITKFRERQKLDQIDDPLDRSNAFQVIRGILLNQSFPRKRGSPSELSDKHVEETS